MRSVWLARFRPGPSWPSLNREARKRPSVSSAGPAPSTRSVVRQCTARLAWMRQERSLRTGPIQAGPAVRRYRPKRDAYGCRESPASSARATIPVPGDWLARLKTVRASARPKPAGHGGSCSSAAFQVAALDRGHFHVFSGAAKQFAEKLSRVAAPLRQPSRSAGELVLLRPQVLSWDPQHDLPELLSILEPLLCFCRPLERQHAIDHRFQLPATDKLQHREKFRLAAHVGAQNRKIAAE